MPWNPNIPVDTNQVRGVSGDVTRMRENFQTLNPIVISGLNGLSGVAITAAASGDILRYDGTNWVDAVGNLAVLIDVDTSGAVSGQALTYNGSLWVPATPVQTLSGLTDTDVTGAVSGDALTFIGGNQWEPRTAVAALGDLTDVDTAGAVSGQILGFDGTEWTPTDPAGRVSRAMLVLGTDQSITQDVATVVTGMTQTVNVGSWATNPASGVIQVPSGVSLIEARAQATWDTGGGGDQCKLRLLIDGAGVTSGEVQDVRWFSGATFNTANNIASWAIAVSGGEALTLEVEHSEGGAESILSANQQTWFEVRAVSGGTGGGGGGAGTLVRDFSKFDPDAPPVSPPSGTTFNDEFDDDSLDAKWIWWDPNGDLLLSGIDQSTQRLVWRLPGGSEWAGVYQDITGISGVGHALFTKLSMTTRATLAADEYMAGLALFDDATGNPSTAGFYVAGIYTDTDPAANLRTRIGMFAFDNYLDSTPTLLNYDDVLPDLGLSVGGIYIRVVRAGGGDLSFSWSMDGLSWRQLADFTPSFTPTEAGLVGRNWSGGNLDCGALFFRHWNATNRDLVLSGALVGQNYAGDVSVA
jgi:hypothetical protein